MLTTYQIAQFKKDYSTFTEEQMKAKYNITRKQAYARVHYYNSGAKKVKSRIPHATKEHVTYSHFRDEVFTAKGADKATMILGAIAFVCVVVLVVYNVYFV